MGTTARRAVASATATATATATAVALGLLLTGAGTAWADDPDTTAAQGPITLSPEQSVAVCTTRIPGILSRVDRVTTRIGADAVTRGSTAWLQARQDRAEAAGRAEEADRLQRRIDRRPEQLDRLAEAKAKAIAFRDANCVG
jgi:hypothetical protein